METILQDVLKLINDAMGYLRLFVIGGTAFFVAKDYALKMASSGEASLYRPTAAEIVLI